MESQTECKALYKMSCLLFYISTCFDRFRSLSSYMVSGVPFPGRSRPMSCWLTQTGSRPITFLWLWPATDREQTTLPTRAGNKIWRWTDSAPCMVQLFARWTQLIDIHYTTHIHTHTRLTALCPRLPGWAGTRKVKPIWILLKQQTVSGSGISWAMCKSAPHSRQITMPAPHHSVFYRPDALHAAQPTASKHWRHKHWRHSLQFTINKIVYKIFGAMSKNLYIEISAHFGIESVENLVANRRNRFINRYGEKDDLCQMLR